MREKVHNTIAVIRSTEIEYPCKIITSVRGEDDCCLAIRQVGRLLLCTLPNQQSVESPLNCIFLLSSQISTN